MKRCCAASVRRAVPHPLGKDSTVKKALGQERRLLQPIRAMADIVVDSSRFNVHELRSHITAKFTAGSTDKDIMVSVVSFGYKTGVPNDADLLFDVRFLPNPHFIPAFRPLYRTPSSGGEIHSLVSADAGVY